MKLLAGTGHQNCSMIETEIDELICLCCPHSTAEDMKRRPGHTLVNSPMFEFRGYWFWLGFSHVWFSLSGRCFQAGTTVLFNKMVLTKLGWGKALLQRQGWSPEQRVRRKGVEVTLAGGSQDPWEQQWPATKPSSQPAEVVSALFKLAVLQTWMSLSKEKEPTA